jgi:hypothetical protein
MTQAESTHPAVLDVDERSVEVVAALVSAGLVDPVRSAAATQTVATALAGAGHREVARGDAAGPEPWRGRLAEVIGYLGAVLVVCALGLFTLQKWADLSLGQRLGLLALVTVVLGTAGVAVVRSAGGPAAILADAQDVRRRQASVLLTAAACGAGAAVGVYLYDGPRSPGPWGALAYAVIAGLSLVGYRLAPSAAGQLGVAFGVAVGAGVAVTRTGRWQLTATGAVVLAVGLLWVALAERNAWREVVLARFLGASGAFAGGQFMFDWPGHSWVGYTVTFFVGAAGFAFYLARRAWPYLALGVVALTCSITQATFDWTDNALGVAGGMLVAGVVFLASGLFGLRLRRQSTA